jgi:hypothetical protein
MKAPLAGQRGGSARPEHAARHDRWPEVCRPLLQSSSGSGLGGDTTAIAVHVQERTGGGPSTSRQNPQAGSCRWSPRRAEIGTGKRAEAPGPERQRLSGSAAGMARVAPVRSGNGQGWLSQMPGRRGLLRSAPDVLVRSCIPAVAGVDQGTRTAISACWPVPGNARGPVRRQRSPGSAPETAGMS